MLWWRTFLLSFLSIVECQIQHSIDRMSAAIQYHGALADQLQDYVVREEKRLKQIELYIQKLRIASVNKQLNKQDLEQEMSHPVRVLRFITDIYADIENIRLSIDMSRASKEMNDTLALLPSSKDYVDAVQAVVRLQEVYEDDADFSKAQGNNTRDVLTADEIFEIGRVCIDQKNFFSALNNMKKAKEMYEAVNDTSAAMQAYDYLSYIMHEQGNPAHALNYTHDLLNYYTGEDEDTDTVTRLRENMVIYVNSLGGEEAAAEMVKLEQPYENIQVERFRNYNELCRGESVEMPNKDKKPLKCYLHTNNNHPSLILAPAKKEELNSKTGLSFFHHVLTDREIKLLQDKASVKFGDSQLVPDADTKNNPDVQLEDEHSYSDGKIRSSNTGWVDDTDDEMIHAISKRISAILDLTLTSAESFQVLSYGIGGFYLPHFDWGDSDDSFEGFNGNRIATWIFYLNDIKRGGATVFPDIGATVWPEKGGAAFWRNLYQNGTGNPLTLHAACPVLEGYKWASNKWFHTVGNELSWPCGLTSEM